MTTPQGPYPARLDIDYPEGLDRFTTLLRLIWIVPILREIAIKSRAADSTAVVKSPSPTRVSTVGSSLRMERGEAYFPASVASLLRCHRLPVSSNWEL
jgi:hypothetical protein